MMKFHPPPAPSSHRFLRFHNSPRKHAFRLNHRPFVRAISYGRPQPPLDRDFLSVQRDDGTKAPCNKVLKRVFAVSDCHTEYVANYDWCKALDSRNYQQDILIVAGDVCDDLDLLRETLSHLVERFARVFYTFGNHELWVRPIDKARGIETSWEKLQRVFEICESLNVCTHPEKIGELWVVPLHSWHHASFDDEPDIPDIPLASRLTISDYSACVWPEDLIKGNVSNGSYDIAAFIDSLNDRRDQWWGKLLEDRPNCDVISFSHFLPDMRLIPEKRFLFYPNLTKASGSLLLKERVALLHPDVHVFGHTHFAWDSKVGGTRYIQAPLCSPLERERRFQSICFANSPLSHHGKPVSASWLPLEIYSFTHSAPLEVTRAEEERNMGDQQQVSYQHPKNDPCDRLTQTSEAVHDNVHLNIQTGMDEQCMDNGDDPFSEELMRLDDGRIGEGGMLTRTMNDGRVQLRHGDCPEILGAHWSRYYELYARNPDNITLAPWVSGIYKRRRLKRKRSGS